MLAGKRVKLRAITRADLPRLAEFDNDLIARGSASTTPPIPLAVERLESEFANSGSKSWRDGIGFAIEVEGIVVGQCGLSDLSRYNGVSRSCSLFIFIGDKSYWGRGIGREAVLLLLEYGFRYWNLNRIALQASSANVRARRCYAACGFLEEGLLRENEWDGQTYRDTVCMSILRREWEPALRETLGV